MKSDKTAKIIAFEGIDGSGKGVQFGRLYETLLSEGAKVGQMDFPVYDRFFGKEIGRMLSGAETVTADSVDIRSMSLWYAMDRYMAFRDTDTASFDYLLLNRSTLSNAVYQSARCREEEKRAAVMTWIEELEFDQLKIPKPDLYIIFDIPASQSAVNVSKKGCRDYVGEKADVYEADRSFMEAVREGYLRAPAIFENAVVLNCMGPDGMLSVEEIAGMVRDTVREKLGK